MPTPVMRLLSIVSLLALSACEGSLGLNLSATPPENVNAAVLKITGVRLLREDGETETIDFDPAKQINLLNLSRGDSAQLFSNKTVPATNYTGLSLLIEADTQELDSYLEAPDGGQTSLILRSGASTTVNQEFVVKDDKDRSLALHFDLRSSLYPLEDDATDQEFAPKLRLLIGSEYGQVSGDLNEQVLLDGNCSTDTSDEIGHVIYIYAGNDVEPDDIDGISPEPVSTALLRRSDTRADYVASYLSPGDYTLAFTCEADQDAPNTDDDIAFIRQLNVSVQKSQTHTLNFD